MLFFALIVAAVAAFTQAKTLSTRVPESWKFASALSPSKVLQVKFALKPRNAEAVEKTLLDISTPGSANFRHHLKHQQVLELTARPDSDYDRLNSWVKSLGGSVTIPANTNDWVLARLPVSAIQSAFNCRLGSYVHAETGRYKVAAQESYTIPSELEDLIELVSGLNTFPSSHWKVQKVDADAATPASITPSTIYEVYQTDSTMKARAGSQAVVEFGNNADFSTSDLQTFFKNFQPALVGETASVVFGDNNGATSHPSVEANLDIQYIMAVGVAVNSTDYKITSTTRGESIEDEFLDYSLLVNSEIQPPLVQSISYGEYGGSYDNATDQRFSYELQLMGLKGVSVLLASGDNGVGCDSTGSSQEFDYPSSPYLTMVGATFLDASSKQEVGATLSSGGFSKDFMQASWQASAVNGYFNSGVALPTEAYYKPGRAYPDVSAFGQNVQVVASGKSEAVSGTSCSAPIFAGVIALINAELLAAGKAPLGFLNPWLYANPTMFTDVLTGSNPYQKCSGFTATKGWDPVTGLGTPIYPAMLKAALNSA